MRKFNLFLEPTKNRLVVFVEKKNAPDEYGLWVTKIYTCFESLYDFQAGCQNVRKQTVPEILLWATLAYSKFIEVYHALKTTLSPLRW